MMVKCPKCGKMTPWEGNPYRPFCSKRCKEDDLYFWLSDDEEEDGSDDGADSSSNYYPVDDDSYN